MKKRAKHKNTDEKKDVSGLSEAKASTEDMLLRIQEQLGFLEKKIDALVAQGARPQHEPRRFDRDERPRHFGGDRHGGGNRERTFTKAVCSECGAECELPFRPTGDRPVYCKDCFSKRKAEGSNDRSFGGPRGEGFGGNRSFGGRPHEGNFNTERHFGKRHDSEGRGGFDKKRKPGFRRKK